MIEYVEGYIEKAEILLDGSLPCGVRDQGKPRKTMYFATIDSPPWVGKLRDTLEEAADDGRRICKERNVFVPCFQSSCHSSSRLRDAV